MALMLPSIVGHAGAPPAEQPFASPPPPRKSRPGWAAWGWMIGAVLCPFPSWAQEDDVPPPLTPVSAGDADESEESSSTDVRQGLLLLASRLETSEKGPSGQTQPLGFKAEGGSLSRVLMRLAFTFYRNAISSQDGAVCGFSPSCSGFAQQALQQAGPVRGSLLTVDRLLRDHPLSHERYVIDPQTGRAIDPMKSYCSAIGGCR